MCSDILTPLPALGVPFEIDDIKGPLIANPVRTLDQVCAPEPAILFNTDLCTSTRRLSILFSFCAEQVRQLHDVDLSQLQFVGDALTCLRQEVHGQVQTVLLLYKLAPASCYPHKAIWLHRQLFLGLLEVHGLWQHMSLKAAVLPCTRPSKR